MQFTIEKIEPLDKAVARMRLTPLDGTMRDEEIKVYLHAHIRLGEFFAGELNPTSLYVLKNQLSLLRDMRHQLLNRYNIDILQLDSILHIRNDKGELFGMAPPVVEIYEEDVMIVPRKGDRSPPGVLSLLIPILKDGIHRMYIAYYDRVPVKCIVIRGAAKEHLPYAYPNEWKDVMIFDAKPEVDQKKYFRRQERYSYMRPLRALRQTGDEPAAPEYGGNYRS